MAAGRRHHFQRTPDLHPAALDENNLMAHCQTRRERRSGPGGQHRNKVETAIVITHIASGIKGEASERRSQAQNRQKALHRLRVNLALRIRLPVQEEIPSGVWQQHTQSGKIVVNRDHRNFPTLLAEALDVLEAETMDARSVSERLGCTPSQLVKLLQSEPRAILQVNQQRQAAGLHALR
jgi:hypothetical protein